MSAADWAQTSARALAVFSFGQAEAAKRGLILVDTKYEFGRDPASGEILLIDEVHTPDSSRYWLSASYAARLAAGSEPENIDKEFLRLWFRANCDPYSDALLPAAPGELVAELSRRYIQLYEAITGLGFDAGASAPSAGELAAACAAVTAPAGACVLVLRTGGEECSGAAAAAAAALAVVRLAAQRPVAMPRSMSMSVG
jgi:phosphoribosylaminoimidazole-succinocarboxamide synthase